MTDGPYAETREQLGGFFLLEARDRREAVELALCPARKHRGAADRGSAARGAPLLRPVLIIASTGRCGTRALCDALTAASDHRVRHEPEPLLLEEAQRAYHGHWRYSWIFLQRLLAWRRLDGTPYGEAVRCPTLLGDIARVTRSARFVILFREPEQYVRSAWGRGVLRKGNAWDRYRLLPNSADALAIGDQIALHYAEVNRILADFAVRYAKRVTVCETNHLDRAFPPLCTFAGVKVLDRAAAEAILSARPNAGPLSRYGESEAPMVSAQARSAAVLAYQRLRGLAEDGDSSVEP